MATLLTVHLHGDILGDGLQQPRALCATLDACAVVIARRGADEQLIDHHGGALLDGGVAGADQLVAIAPPGDLGRRATCTEKSGEKQSKRKTKPKPKPTMSERNMAAN